LPVILLGRLAASKRYQRYGLGESLLSEAVGIAGLASESIVVVALVVHPISKEASDFYRKHGFSIAKTEKPMLFLGLH
jgi:ribosomal protein S18 acetylase RimI-like enzyme